MLEAQWNISDDLPPDLESYEGPLLVDVRGEDTKEVAAVFGAAQKFEDIEFLLLAESGEQWSTFYEATSCARPHPNARYNGVWQRAATDHFDLSFETLPGVPLDNILLGITADSRSEVEEHLHHLEDLPQPHYWLRYHRGPTDTLEDWKRGHLDTMLRTQFRYVITDSPIEDLPEL